MKNENSAYKLIKIRLPFSHNNSTTVVKIEYSYLSLQTLLLIGLMTNVLLMNTYTIIRR